MRTGTYYLNNNGSRWVIYQDGKKPQHTFMTSSGVPVIRTAIEYFSFGNFGGILINYKGKRIRVLSDTILP